MTEFISTLAGLGLFLTGLHFLSASMKPLAGKQLRLMLAKMTGSYTSAAFVGTALGALTQSTSGSTFVCMGLVNSGALKFRNALNIIAWSSVGGSLLVFLVSIDIRLAGLVLIAVVGLSNLFNFDRIEKVKYLVAILLALGILLLGLGMIKDGGHLLRESQWIKDFIQFASETTAICFIIGLFFSVITQSASTVTIIGITLVLSKIIPFEAAVVLVFGANLGSGLSLLFITSHLTGIQKQLSFYQFLTKLSGVLLIMPIFVLLPSMFYMSGYDPSQLNEQSRIAFQISVIYLVLQISGALVVGLFQEKIITQLSKLFPEKEEDSLAKPKYIYPEAIDDPDIAISLIKKEQERLVSSLSHYLDPLRNLSANFMSTAARNEANMLLANEIKHFIDEISQHELGKEMSAVLELQSHNEAIISLLGSLNSFSTTVSETENFKDGLSGSIIESLHLILTLMEETTSSHENVDFLLELTSDKSQLMDTIRNTLLAESGGNLATRKSLFVSTRVYERILWQIRQILNALPTITST
jgi:phosphate:Na+ symporter